MKHSNQLDTQLANFKPNHKFIMMLSQYNLSPSGKAKDSLKASFIDHKKML